MSEIGANLLEIDTPALWVDLDLLDANIRKLSQYFKDAGVAWRPHTKGIKIPAVVHKLMAAGASGITCSKLSEAEVMAASGITEILIANQVVGENKALRLASLQRQAHVIAAVDDLGNAGQISRAAQACGVRVPVVIELDTGMERCGIQPGPGAVSFAQQVAVFPGLDLVGLMAWEGHVVRIQDLQEKKAQTEKAVGALVATARMCREAGLAVPIVSCGGTGSYRFTAHIPGVTEIQAGGGIFGGIIYRQWRAGLEDALFVLATVTSHTAPDRAVVDAGRKAMNVEYTAPQPVGRSGMHLAHFSAEHSVLEIEPGAQEVCVGDKINFVVGYEDLTVFLHDRLYGVRQGKVEVIWDIVGRGKLA